MEKKSFSKRLVDYFFCGHKELLYLGGVQTKVGKVDTYVYMCKNCGRVLKKSYRLEFTETHLSTRVLLGKIVFSYKNKFSSKPKEYDIENFYRLMIDTKIEYSREQLRTDFKYLEDIISNTYKQNLELLRKLQQRENVIIELKKQNDLLSSVAENKDNVIYDEKQLSILSKNEMQIHNSGMLKEWLTLLLIEKKVLVPMQNFKLFKSMLTVLYGYENMRNKWEFVDKEFDNVKYVEVKNREKRRANR